jgi:hypothetical protein
LSAPNAPVLLRLTSGQRHKKAAPTHLALSAGSFLTCSSALPLPLSPPGLFHGNLSECNALDGGPDDGQATHLGGEHINLIGALANEAPQTLDGIGRPDVAVHHLRKVVKGLGFVFLFGQAPHSLWVELTIFGECSRPVGSRHPACSGTPRYLVQVQGTICASRRKDGDPWPGIASHISFAS